MPPRARPSSADRRRRRDGGGCNGGSRSRSDRRRRVVAVLAERIEELSGLGLGLLAPRDDLAAHRTVWILAVDQREVVRRRADAEQSRGGGEAGALGRRQVDE